MYIQSQKMKYVHASVVAIRSQVKTAKKNKQKGDIDMYNTVTSMIRTELFFINLIGILNYDKYKLLQQIVNNMLESY